MHVFDAEEMMGWIGEILAHGPRRPGSEADLAVEAMLAERLRGFGFEGVRLEPIPIKAWREGVVSLEAAGPGGSGAIRPEVQAIPYAAATGEGGVEGPLVPAEEGGDWRGKVVVAEIGFPLLDTKLLLNIAMGSYDPDDSLKEVEHPATWVRLGWHHYRRAIRRGAAGFVGVLKDQPGGTCRMFAPYGFREADILDKPVPGAWVGRDDGAALLRLARGGGARARLVTSGSLEDGVTHNVVAELPGRGLDGEATVLSCHHDSPFDSPVEDASGCAVVLALARRFSAERPLRRRLVVLFSAGHFYGSIGTRTFLREHRDDLVRRTALEVSIEHIAREAVEGEGGRLVPTGRPEPTAMFVSFSRAIAEALLAGVEAHGMRRVILLPAEGPLGDYPPTDGGDWYEAGVPVINCISNPVYLLTDQDALDWVDRDRLPQVAGAFDAILRRLDAEPREALASTKSWPYRLAMKGLGLATTAVMTRLGTRPLH
jgi:hypothetical protein